VGGLVELASQTRFQEVVVVGVVVVVSVGNSVAVYNTASVIQYIYSLIQYTDCIPWVIRKKYNTV
jgi:hypothetical protein